MSLSALVSYEFVDVHLLHFGLLNMRHCTELQLSIGYIYILNNFGGLDVSNRVAM